MQNKKPQMGILFRRVLFRKLVAVVLTIQKADWRDFKCAVTKAEKAQMTRFSNMQILSIKQKRTGKPHKA